ncbi:MAG: hypothetical protein AB2L14_30290 [Candidatus Xenobiia bacterium LiM19]
MEKAVFIAKKEHIPLIKNDFTRIYFGQEFCERLIPSKEDLEEVLRFARDGGLAFTLVTPFLTEQYLHRWMETAKKVHERMPDAEIVINDWGFLRLIRKELASHPCLLGRLLCKQKRGPQILRIVDKVPPTMLDHFRRSTSDVPITREFLKTLGITRIELDNLLQGMERDNDIPGSLYYPFGYITTTRLCLSNSCTSRKESLRAIFPCKKECQHISFTLTHKDMPVPVYLAGNAQFYHCDKLPDNPEKLNIDRLVFEPEIPV